MTRMVAYIANTGENKMKNIATFISNVKDAYRTAIIKVKAK